MGATEELKATGTGSIRYGKREIQTSLNAEGISLSEINKSIYLSVDYVTFFSSKLYFYRLVLPFCYSTFVFHTFLFFLLENKLEFVFFIVPLSCKFHFTCSFSVLTSFIFVYFFALNSIKLLIAKKISSLIAIASNVYTTARIFFN